MFFTWAVLLLPFIGTCMGSLGVYSIRKFQPELLQCLDGSAAGVMTAASVWSLLLPAMEQTVGVPVWMPAATGLLTGALFLAGLDGLLPRLRPREKEDALHRRDRLLMLAITSATISKY